jgi:predicted metalloprotease with PDZ domain
MADAIHYDVHLADPSAHVFEVRLTVAEPAAEGQQLWLPVWIPGSYMIREFAKNIVRISATCNGAPVGLRKLDKTSWQADPCDGPLEVTYEVYAWELTVRLAHFDANHAFFNGTSLFLAVAGQEGRPHAVTLHASDALPDWQVATSLPRRTGGTWDFGEFEAVDYDDLVDHPVEMGTFVHARFDACGTPHDLVVTGHTRFDMARLVADLKPICEQHIRMFGEPAPMARYVFLLMVTGGGYGGLEHRASSANICKRADLPKVGVPGVDDGYRKLLGLLSHEYFHTWNVKRIKPRAFVPYDLRREAHTTLLWAFEGITSYYDDLGLLRAGRIDTASWLELLGQTLTRVERVAGRHKQSVGASSFDAWTKFYRQDENAPNAIVSYYAKGAVVALALDLELRRRSDGAVSLDDVMRGLWERFGDGSGVVEDGIETLASELVGEDMSDFFDQAVRGTEDLPVAELLGTMGVRLNRRAAVSTTDAGGRKRKDEATFVRGDLGVSVKAAKHGAQLRFVHDGGAARAAGLSAQDVVVAFDGLRVTGTDLFDRARELPAGTTVTVHAFRADVLHTFEVTLQPAPLATIWLELDEEAALDVIERRERWLGV